MSYTLNIFSLDSVTLSDPGLMTDTVTGEHWEWYVSPTLTVNTGATATTVGISDTDGSPTLFSDDSEGQLTTSEVTIGGTTYPAGSMLSDEYEVTLTDGTTDYRLVAVAIREYSDEVAYTDTIIGYTWEGATPPENVTLTYVSSTNQDYASMVTCFACGTMIETADGARPVEKLRAGDLLLTQDGRAQPLAWLGRRHVSDNMLRDQPNLRPIRIRAGALGFGIPATDLWVSPQHRILAQSLIAQRIGGVPEVLVAAKHLLGLPGIEIDTERTEVSYIHLFCRTHEVIIANGAATESLLPGPQAMAALSFLARQHFKAQFGDLGAVAPARVLLTGQQGRKLALRHAQHDRALQEPNATMPRVTGSQSGSGAA